MVVCPLFVLGVRDVSAVTSSPIVPCSPSHLSGANPGIRCPMLCPDEGVVGEGPRVTMCPLLDNCALLDMTLLNRGRK